MKKRNRSRQLRYLAAALAAVALSMFPVSPAFACHAFAFESGTYSAAEDAATVKIVVKRDTEHLQGRSSVKVTTTDQSAESGKDYTAFNQAVSFEPGDTSKSIEIALKDDTIFEGAENFAVKLSTDPGSPQECTFGSGGFAPSPNPAVVTIQENDPQTSATSKPGQTSSPPANKPGASPSASSPTKSPPAAASPSPGEEEVGANVAGDVAKQKDDGPPIKTILLIAGILVVVGGAIGGYFYLGTRD